MGISHLRGGIQCRTGLPGSGKSLSVVAFLVEHFATDDARPVYVHGVAGLVGGPWSAIGAADVRKWDDLPSGSIVVVDEAQKLMPSRRSGDAPAWIQALSEHRHRGIDFILVTQNVALLDSYVRRLISEHLHFIRKFGTQMSDVYTFACAEANVDSPARRKAAERRDIWKFPKAIMSKYESAEVHTIKRRLPRWLYVAGAMLVIVPALVWYGVHRVTGGTAGDAAAVSSGGNPSLLGGVSEGLGGLGASAESPMTTEEWVLAHVPRVLVKPWSAPVYDELEVQRVPELYCVSIEHVDPLLIECLCYTEQATPYVGVDFNQCRYFALNGSYNPYREDADRVGRGGWQKSGVDGVDPVGGLGAPDGDVGGGPVSVEPVEPVHGLRSSYDPPWYPSH